MCPDRCEHALEMRQKSLNRTRRTQHQPKCATHSPIPGSTWVTLNHTNNNNNNNPPRTLDTVSPSQSPTLSRCGMQEPTPPSLPLSILPRMTCFSGSLSSAPSGRAAPTQPEAVAAAHGRCMVLHRCCVTDIPAGGPVTASAPTGWHPPARFETVHGCALLPPPAAAKLETTVAGLAEEELGHSPEASPTTDSSRSCECLVCC